MTINDGGFHLREWFTGGGRSFHPATADEYRCFSTDNAKCNDYKSEAGKVITLRCHLGLRPVITLRVINNYK